MKKYHCPKYNPFRNLLFTIIIFITGNCFAQYDSLYSTNEFILPASSTNLGIGLNVASYTIRGASTLTNTGIEPVITFSNYWHLNRRITHSCMMQAQYAWANNIRNEQSTRLSMEIGYRASFLLAPFGLITGISYKTNVYDCENITPNRNFWLTRWHIPAELYWTKLLPSKNACLIQVSTPLVELVSSSGDSYKVPILNDEQEDLTFALINSDFEAAIPFVDLFALKLGVAYIKSYSRTKALKIALIYQYYHLYDPVYVNADTGLNLIYQF